MSEEIIRKALSDLKSRLPDNVTLVAVSKTKPAADVQFAYNLGHRDFGENKVQEMVSKAEILPGDIRWHLIGHLQTNKVKYIVDFVHLIHSVDSLKLLQEINKRSAASSKITNCLFQIYIADEESKFGLSENELNDILNGEELRLLKNVRICGLMGMATLTDDENKIRNEFNKLSKLFQQIRLSGKLNSDFNILSMGMTSDFDIAIDCGSNMVRIGSMIFGERH